MGQLVRVYSSGDRLLIWVLRGCGAVTGAVVVLIAAFLVSESLPGLRRIGPGRFFSDPSAVQSKSGRSARCL